MVSDGAARFVPALIFLASFNTHLIPPMSSPPFLPLLPLLLPLTAAHRH
jgi:hypothetical protein